MGLLPCYSVVKSQKAVSADLTSKLTLPFSECTSERGRPFINARVFINTHRKCAASAYKRTVVFKWAAIYKRLDPYLLTMD